MEVPASSDLAIAKNHFKTKIVYIASINSDLTEGRGYSYPLCVCELMGTALRLGHKKNVQGTNADTYQALAIQIGHEWYAPVRIVSPSTEDKKVDETNRRRRAAWDKAKAAGLTDEDLKVLTEGK